MFERQYFLFIIVFVFSLLSLLRTTLLCISVHGNVLISHQYGLALPPLATLRLTGVFSGFVTDLQMFSLGLSL